MGLPNPKTSTFTCNIVSSLDYLFKIRGNFAHFSIGKGPVLPVFGPNYGRGKSLTDAYFSTCYIINFLFFLSAADFSKYLPKNPFQEIFNRMSNSLDQGQACCSVGPDLEFAKWPLAAKADSKRIQTMQKVLSIF